MLFLSEGWLTAGVEAILLQEHLPSPLPPPEKILEVGNSHATIQTSPDLGVVII